MWILGPYQLNPATFELTRSGAPVALSRRPFDLLVELITHAGRVTSREELRTRVWAGTRVSEGAIDTALYEARAAIGDLERPGKERWIETVRGRGFRYRGPAERSVGLQGPKDGIPFAGREPIVEDLARTLRKAIRGEGSFVLIEGVAGMGKTRLLQEVSRFASPADVATAWCEVGAPPYWPWLQLAEHLELDADDGERHEDDAKTRAQEWFAASNDEAEDDRLRFDRQRRIESNLQKAARRRPRLLLLEDLHWADTQSVALLESLAQRVAGLPVAIFATTRPDGEGGERVARLIRSSHVRRISLRPLDNAAVLKFVEPIIGRIPPADVASEIRRRSEGIPLFIREVAEQVEVDGESDFFIPPVAKTVLERRFEPLAPDSHLPLALAALCGERFDVPLVEEAGREAIVSPRAWVKDAVQHGILIADPRNPLRLAFAHALMRDVAESHFSNDALSHWHRRIADTLAERTSDPSGPTLSRLARHYAAAALLEADLAQPLRFVLLAARSAADLMAWEDVRVHADHVLNWIPMVPHSPERDAQEREARLLRCAGMAGQTGHVDETESHLERLDALLRTASRDGDEDRALVAAFRYSNARTRGDVAAIGAAAGEIQAIPGMEAVAACWRSAAAGLGGRTEESTASLGADDALPRDPDFRGFARRCGWDPWVEALGLSAFGCWAAGDASEARRRSERAISWAIEQDDQRSRIWAVFLSCLLLDLMDDWKTLAERGREIEELCQRYAISPWQGFGVGMQVWAQSHLTSEDPAPSAQLGEIMRAQGLAAHTSMKSGILFSAARSYARAGALDEAEATLGEVEAFCGASGEKVLLPEIHRWQGEIAQQRGDEPRARACYEAARTLARDQRAHALERRAAEAIEAIPG